MMARSTNHGLAVLVVLLACGCPQQGKPPVPAVETPEKSWQQQVEAVRRGQSDEIRVLTSVVTDADLAALDDLKDALRRLNLSRTEITDAGLARIALLSNLVQLRLAAPRVTDAGVAELSQLAELKHLHLIDVPLTDSGLSHLEVLKQLESLYLDHTRATDAGGAALAKALPQTHLHFDGGHAPGHAPGPAHRHE